MNKAVFGDIPLLCKALIGGVNHVRVHTIKTREGTFNACRVVRGEATALTFINVFTKVESSSNTLTDIIPIYSFADRGEEKIRIIKVTEGEYYDIPTGEPITGIVLSGCGFATTRPLALYSEVGAQKQRTTTPSPPPVPQRRTQSPEVRHAIFADF